MSKGVVGAGAGGYLIAALIGGAVGAGITWSSTASPARSAAVQANAAEAPARSTTANSSHPAVESTVPDIVEKAGPAVVRISTSVRRSAGGLFGGPDEELDVKAGEGSGFVVDGRKGHIVTNFHVIRGASRLSIDFPDGKTVTGAVVGGDPMTDVALVKVESSTELPSIELAGEEPQRVGETLIAIGNPFGLQSSVTVGVLSQVGRKISEGHIRGVPLEDLLQTDAAINPGNSGGPLINLQGHVVGMNTAINPAGQGLGFAVAARTIRKVIADLEEHGKVIRPWVGVGIVRYTPELAQREGLAGPDVEGVLVVSVDRGLAADRAGMQPDDVITEVAGARVTDAEAFRAGIRDRKPGDRVAMKGFRGDRGMDWTVTLTEAPGFTP